MLRPQVTASDVRLDEGGTCLIRRMGNDGARREARWNLNGLKEGEEEEG